MHCSAAVAAGVCPSGIMPVRLIPAGWSQQCPCSGVALLAEPAPSLRLSAGAALPSMHHGMSPDRRLATPNLFACATRLRHVPLVHTLLQSPVFIPPCANVDRLPIPSTSDCQVTRGMLIRPRHMYAPERAHISTLLRPRATHMHACVHDHTSQLHNHKHRRSSTAPGGAYVT